MFRQHRLGTRSVAIVALVSGALLLAACSAPRETSTTDAASAAPDLKLAAVSGPNSLDTAQLVDGQQAFVWASVYDTLLARDQKTGAVAPNAAESWKYNADGTVLTLKLHPHMTFANGDPVNAEAVAATMLRTKSTPGIVQPKFALVTGVTATDDLTVEITFSSFDPQFVYNLSLGAGAIGDPKSLTSPDAATNPVGSGPYTLDVANSVPGTSYLLKKRDDYWNADAYPFPSVTVRVLQDPTASFNALQAGEINAATVQAQLIGQLDKSKYTISTVPGQALAYLDILDRGGQKWPALGNKNVRQAINHAIDREGILKGIFRGNATLTEQVFSPNGQVSDKSLNDTYDYDPKLGKRLVADAGFAGEKFQIPSTFLTTSVEATLSQAFSDIGLGLEWVAVPPQQAQSALTSGDYGLSFQITGVNSDPADAFFHYSPNGFGNPMHFSDSTIDGLFSKINSTVDEAAALPIYRKLNEYGVEQAFEVPLVFVNSNWATTDGISVISIGGVPSTVSNFAFGAK